MKTRRAIHCKKSNSFGSYWKDKILCVWVRPISRYWVIPVSSLASAKLTYWCPSFLMIVSNILNSWNTFSFLISNWVTLSKINIQWCHWLITVAMRVQWCRWLITVVMRVAILISDCGLFGTIQRFTTATSCLTLQEILLSLSASPYLRGRLFFREKDKVGGLPVVASWFPVSVAPPSLFLFHRSCTEVPKELSWTFQDSWSPEPRARLIQQRRRCPMGR